MSSTLYIIRMNPRDDAVFNHVRQFRRRPPEMTQQELADRVGVTRQTIHAVERGSYNPSVGLALKLARAFGVPVESLFQLEGSGVDE